MSSAKEVKGEIILNTGNSSSNHQRKKAQTPSFGGNDAQGFSGLDLSLNKNMWAGAERGVRRAFFPPSAGPGGPSSRCLQLGEPIFYWDEKLNHQLHEDKSRPF